MYELIEHSLLSQPFSPLKTLRIHWGAAVRPVQIIGSSKIVPADVERLTAMEGANRELVQVFSATVSWAHELLRSLPIASQNTDTEKQKVIAAVLLARVIEVVESVFLLASRRACLETTTLFRVFLDAYFVLANVCSNPDFLSTYFLSDEVERLKLMRAASKRDSEVFRDIREYASDELQRELDSKIRTVRVQALKSFAYAESVGCGNIYDSMYRICSATVHSSPRALENLVETDDEGRVTHIILDANAEDVNRVLYDVHHFFCKSLDGVCGLFEKDRSHISEFAFRLSRIASDDS